MFVQVKAHNERRLGVKWERPVEKLREIILAMRALWDCWQNETKLNFRGEFFKLTLMAPFFNPGPHGYPDVPIYLAGVNPQMCQLAGELAEGFFVHPLHTVRYLSEAILPNLEEGLAKSDRRRANLELVSTVFAIPTDDPAQAQRLEAEVRQQLAFYASTPAYRPVFDMHGWGSVAEALSALAARARWADMPALITPQIMAEFAVSGFWADLPGLIQQKYNGLLDRVSFYLPFVPGEDEAGWRAVVAGFKQSY